MRLAALAGPQDSGALCFVCGPTGFVEHIANLLIDREWDPRQVKTERFGPSGGSA
jgi:ferredoxin-NADP reductase